MHLSRYQDLLAAVRKDNEFHPISSLVQPDWPEVVEIADVLKKSPDFSRACWEFVNSFTTYEREIGDYWTTPAEILERRAGDCDDKAILLTSLLRNQLPPEQVFCAFGFWKKGSQREGHMWVVTQGTDGFDNILESTAAPGLHHKGRYDLEAMFNDKYCFSKPAGIKDFNLLPIAVEG